MVSQVFISSTSEDLQHYREQAQDAALRLGMLPIMMERFDAGEETPLQQINRQLSLCNVCVFVIGFRYGSIPPDSEISFTHHEYLEAGRLRLPRIVLVMSDEHVTTAKNFDRGRLGEQNEELRQLLMQQHAGCLFESEVDFTARLFSALEKYREPGSLNEPATSMVVVSAPTPYVEHQYTLLRPSDCVGRKHELAILNTWANDRRTDSANVFLVEAIGGMGKSALTWKWFTEHKSTFDAQIWWSFYEPNSSFERLMRCVVSYLSLCDDVQNLSFADLEELFLSGVASRRCLIVFDGLERVLRRYSRMDAPFLNDEGFSNADGQDERSISDPRFARLLSAMLKFPQLKLLTSSRLTPLEFEYHGELLPNVEQLVLPGLSQEACLELFTNFDCSGDSEHFLRECESLGYFTIAIRAILGQVQQFRQAPNDYDAWFANQPRFDPFKIPEVHRKHAVIISAILSLTAAQRRIMGTLAAFRIPVHYSTLCPILLSPQVAFGSEESLCSGLRTLEHAGLVGWDNATNNYDLHPVIRSSVVLSIGELGMHVILRSLDEFFTNNPSNTDESSSTSLQIERFNTLLGLGRPDDAWNYYEHELWQTLTVQRGDIRSAIMLLEALYPNGTENAPIVSNVETLSLRLGENYASGGLENKAESLISGFEHNISYYHLASIRLRQLRFIEAEEQARKLINYKTSSLFSIGTGLFQIAAIRISIGDFRTSLTLLDQCEQYLTSHFDRLNHSATSDSVLNLLSHITNVHAMRSVCLAHYGSHDKAEVEIQLAINKAEKNNITPALARAKLIAALIALDRKDIVAARDYASEALFSAREMQRAWLEGSSLLTLARLESGSDVELALEYVDALQFVEGHRERTAMFVQGTFERANLLLLKGQNNLADLSFHEGKLVLEEAASQQWPYFVTELYSNLLARYNLTPPTGNHKTNQFADVLQQLRGHLDVPLVIGIEDTLE